MSWRIEEAKVARKIYLAALAEQKSTDSIITLRASGSAPCPLFVWYGQYKDNLPPVDKMLFFPSQTAASDGPLFLLNRTQIAEIVTFTESLIGKNNFLAKRRRGHIHGWGWMALYADRLTYAGVNPTRKRALQTLAYNAARDEHSKLAVFGSLIFKQQSAAVPLLDSWRQFVKENAHAARVTWAPDASLPEPRVRLVV